MITSCCQSSACLECLLGSNLIPLDGQNRANRSGSGVCPIDHCKKPDVYFKDQIPNISLQAACEWFVRQRDSNSENCTAVSK